MGKYQDLSLFSIFAGIIFFPNFRKSEFGGFEKQEIKLFWPYINSWIFMVHKNHKASLFLMY